MYRVQASEDRWTVTEFLDLKPVARVEARSLSDAVASIVAGAMGPAVDPPAWARLRRQVGGRAAVTLQGPPAMVQLWALYSVEILALYRGVGRPPAPDFRPKSYQVLKDRPPQPSGSFVAFYSLGTVEESGNRQPAGCAIVRYTTPVINAAAVIDGLLNQSGPPPWRTVVASSTWAPGPLRCRLGADDRRSYTLRQRT